MKFKYFRAMKFTLRVFFLVTHSRPLKFSVNKSMSFSYSLFCKPVIGARALRENNALQFRDIKPIKARVISATNTGRNNHIFIIRVFVYFTDILNILVVLFFAVVVDLAHTLLCKNIANDNRLLFTCIICLVFVGDITRALIGYCH